jgi:hypothetical protein
MMPDLLATDPNRRPPRNGDPRPRCAGCNETARRCDTGQWLRADRCCATCNHTPKETP